MEGNEKKFTDSTGRELQIGDMVRTSNTYKGENDGIFCVISVDGNYAHLTQDYEIGGGTAALYHHIAWPPVYEIDEDDNVHYFHEEVQEYNKQNAVCIIDDTISPINFLSGFIHAYDRYCRKAKGPFNSDVVQATIRDLAFALNRMMRRIAKAHEAEREARFNQRREERKKQREAMQNTPD